jgi:Prion-inhibition and propagation
MTDPVSLALGVVSLVTAVTGTFTSTVECFQYVQLGRAFGRDFNKYQIRLHALQMRLSRWGLSVGLLPDDSEQRHEISVAQDEADLANSILKCIIEDMQELQKKSARYLKTKKAGSEELAVLDTADLEPQYKPLDQKMKTIWNKRIQSVSLLKRTGWAVYDKTYFDRLLEDTSKNLEELERMFPQAKEPQRALSLAEVGQVKEVDSKETPSLNYLREAGEADKDELLMEAVKQAISANAGQYFTDTVVEGDAQLHQGNKFTKDHTGEYPVPRTSQHFERNVFRGHARGQQGNIYE